MLSVSRVRRSFQHRRHRQDGTQANGCPFVWERALPATFTYVYTCPEGRGVVPDTGGQAADGVHIASTWHTAAKTTETSLTSRSSLA